VTATVESEQGRRTAAREPRGGAAAGVAPMVPEIRRPAKRVAAAGADKPV